jgi:ATP-binding cassette subfamily B protein
MTANKAMPLGKRFALTRRAFEIQWKINRKFFLSKVFYGILSTLSPFVAIWFSARLLSELAGQCRLEKLVLWAVCAACAGFLIRLLTSSAEHWKNANELTYWHRAEHLYAEKMQSMDYEDVEDASVHELRSQIDQNDNYSRFGLNRPLWEVNEIISALTGILASAIMTVSLFHSKVSIGYGMQWLNSPLCVVLLLGLILASASVSIRMTTISTESVFGMTAVAHIKKGNRIWVYYGFRLPDLTKAGMDVRLYRLERGIAAALKQHRKEDWDVQTAIARIHGRCDGISQLSGSICYGLCYLYVALKALGAAFPIGFVVQYVGAIGQFSASVQKLAISMTTLIQNATYLELTYSFLDIENKKYMGTLPVEKRDDNEYAFEFRDVSFQYPGSDTYALKHLNFRFKLGTKLAVVGMNGSGKSTMIKLLCRLYDPTEGEILLNGINIQKYDYDEYLSLFSVVFQDFQLFSFTLGENVAASRSYDRDKAQRCLEEAGFGERLSQLPNGLDTYLNQDFDKSGVEMSGGEAQKIALARALYKDAPFVVLDEPTAALDPLAEYEIYTRFNDMVGSKTAVYISHRLSSCRFCDEIAVFQGGALVQYGSHAELLKDQNGQYYALWTAQAQYYTEEGSDAAVDIR